MLVKIGEVDISEYIISDSYSVNEQDVTNSWVDANRVTHQDVVRQRISGDFKLKFNKESDYADFCQLIKEKRTSDHRLPMTLYVVNLNEEKEITAFYSFLPALR